MADTAVKKALLIIEKCADAKKLRQIAAKARERGQTSVAHAADPRLCEVLPSEKPGTLEHDVWKSVHALEDTLTKERGTPARIGRTRPKIARVGELVTIKDLIIRKEPSEGFFMLLERQMPELTFEAVAPRHPNQFEAAVVELRRGSRLLVFRFEQTRLNKAGGCSE